MSRLYNPKGFTRRAAIAELLTTYRQPWQTQDMGGISWFSCPADHFVKVCAALPAANLSERQNEAPSVRQFLKVALTFPGTILEGYVVTAAREDERVSVDGCRLLAGDAAQVRTLLARSQRCPPDTDHTDPATGVTRLWWD